MRRTMRIYRRLLGANIRTILEYQADFWIMIVAGILFQVLNLVFLSAVFAKVPTLHGWSYAECVLIAGLYGTVAGLSPLFLEGIWMTAWLANHSGFDYKLVRPVSVLAQTAGLRIGLHGFGDVLTGSIMVGWALSQLEVTWQRLLVGAVIWVCAAAIHLSIVTMTNSASFWIAGPVPYFAVCMHNVEDMVRYPITIYGQAVKGIFTLVVPFAFVTFFPVQLLLGKPGGWVGLLTPLVAVACVFAARRVFQAGLRKYDGAGH